MSTAPMPPSNHPHWNAGSPGGPFPPPPPTTPRRRRHRQPRRTRSSTRSRPCPSACRPVPTSAASTFDAPATHRYTGEEWDRAKEKAEQSGVPIEADLTYQNTLEGYLSLRNGRNAAQLQPTDASETAADCARAARVGGFTESAMSTWDLPAKTVLCVLTDKGNIARVVITDFIGGNPQSSIAPPTQIALEVTLWKPGT
ncbi:hypothetical protein ACFQ9H_10770 [Streptomyces sp. NPDC056517]|uniref:hypothetical protein n=1 Tax=Streptomyces sp. NPDC056517 TaxID=3345848 RepID=UPI0036817217